MKENAIIQVTFDPEFEITINKLRKTTEGRIKLGESRI
jgi:hypothetical protein